MWARGGEKSRKFKTSPVKMSLGEKRPTRKHKVGKIKGGSSLDEERVGKKRLPALGGGGENTKSLTT